MKTLIFISLILVACGKNNQATQTEVAQKQLQNEWSNLGTFLKITPSTIDASWKIGAECRYSYTVTAFSNNSDNVDAPMGIMTISNGQEVWNSGAISSCAIFEGTYDYYVLSSGDLGLCPTNGNDCFWFN